MGELVKELGLPIGLLVFLVPLFGWLVYKVFTILREDAERERIAHLGMMQAQLTASETAAVTQLATFTTAIATLQEAFLATNEAQRAAFLKAMESQRAELVTLRTEFRSILDLMVVATKDESTLRRQEFKDILGEVSKRWEGAIAEICRRLDDLTVQLAALTLKAEKTEDKVDDKEDKESKPSKK